MDGRHHIITKDEFDKQWRAIHDRTFIDCYPPDRPFRQSQWEMFLFEGMIGTNEALFHAITPIARQLGDRELIWFVWEDIGESIPPVAVAWDYQALEEVEIEIIRSSFDAHIFGCSGQWGIYSSAQEFVMYVGGEPKFMEALASAMGGRTTIRKEFIRYATDWEITKGEVAEAAIKNMQAIVKSVGWDWPQNWPKKDGKGSQK